MPAKGKHRRPKQNPITRKLALAGTGGAALTLPLISATTAGAAGTSAPAATVTTVTAATVVNAVTAVNAPPTTYSVVVGDTLSEIAADHSVSGGWKQLYEANRAVVGDNPSVIRPGIKLTIGAQAKAATAAKTAVKTAAKPASSYPNNLDGWIRESLDVMAKHGIPGSYNGIHRNVMRESSGNPKAINLWDINAQNGIPSKGLLQVIDPTFKAYHVPGTSLDSYDPVANITAACNYAAARYGSIDNVNGAY
ncbi:peptidoglycan-binding protein [Streptomyces sp. WM6373]|uniref:transglycosylase SLT domain-containing protein n=1 Tax=Streptomyces TaxID=1883 RepID=UPI0004CC3BE2|nr:MULTISPECIES: LysM peptidoglycan-binding domain-containing protein [unclassified Streptomyces]KJY18063.1 peptidoglycan-binding protein [Streptomyces sp. NRRL S-104]KOU43715.1 peptidoglycan-binding protein [Streptomyces sp. WM6373]KOU75439.1 peptidoglycan-binding protein [Streptomyces sp. IGB124]KOU83834.1 peptidoglycan-binding protein [Streptomyces sp. XY66]KOU86339.1 peptidoglycan-binding protein [Streptomyces sp. XY58]